MSNDKRFIVPEDKYLQFNENLNISDFNEYLGGNFFAFKDGKLIKSPCNCTCELENWVPPKEKYKSIRNMNEALEKHIQNEIKILLNIEKIRIEEEIRKKYIKINSSREFLIDSLMI